MKRRSYILLLAACLGIVSSCDDYEQFEKELYEKMIYIVSRKNMVFTVECDMDKETYIYNVSIASSGSNLIDKDVTVVLENDTILLYKYNYQNFETEEEKYAKKLEEWRYEIPSTTVVLKENSEYAHLPIHIQPENLVGLSPDSTYFLPLAIKSVSDYRVNPDKFNALVRICPQNKHARTVEDTYYLMKGHTSNQPMGEYVQRDAINNSSKIMQPLSANEVRIFIGSNSFLPSKLTYEELNRYTLTIKVNEDNTLDIRPYNPDAGLLEVEQLPVETSVEDFVYTNVYEEIPDIYVPRKTSQRFLLYYRYRDREETSHDWSNWKYIGEAISRDYYDDIFEE